MPQGYSNRKLSPAALAVFRACDPRRGDRCSECDRPRRWGEATCGPECAAKLAAALLGDADDAARLWAPDSSDEDASNEPWDPDGDERRTP